MRAKNKNNLVNTKTGARSAFGRDRPSAQGHAAAAVVDISAGRRSETEQAQAAEGLRLVRAFLKIPDPAKRAELIKLAEAYMRRGHR